MTNHTIITRFKRAKYTKLTVSILLDIVGMLSYFIPALGEITDVVFAPITAIIIYVMYGRSFKWAAFNFTEEILPATDIMPSASLAWFFKYVKNENKTLQEFIDRENEQNKILESYQVEQKVQANDEVDLNLK